MIVTGGALGPISKKYGKFNEHIQIIFVVPGTMVPGYLLTGSKSGSYVFIKVKLEVRVSERTLGFGPFWVNRKWLCGPGW